MNQTIAKKLVNIIFILSIPFMAMLETHSSCGIMGFYITAILSFLIGIVIVQKITAPLWEKFSLPVLLLTLVTSLYITYDYSWQGNEVVFLFNFQEALESFLPFALSTKKLVLGIFFASFPAIFILFYFIFTYTVPYIIKFFRSLDRFERSFLTIATLIAIVCIIGVFQQTSLFFATYNADGSLISYDVLYTADCSEIYAMDCFSRILSSENDIRQPLFGLFALPIGLLAKLLSALFFFLPNSYAIGLGILQIILLAITLIMIMRLLQLSKLTDRIFFILFASSCYAYLLYSFMIEQYVIAYFYVILVIYVTHTTDKLNFAYFGAVSTLLTSGILFPLISKAKKLKEWAFDILKCVGIYAVLIIFCGQLPQFLSLTDKLGYLMTFSGESVTWHEKWVQFTHFIPSMFIAPKADVAIDGFYCYRISEQAAVSILGLLILAAVIIGFILTRRELLSKIAILWVVFSFLILFVVGWGTAENGLILYVLYFAWAYLILLYQFIKNIIPNAAIRNVILGISGVSMFIYNIHELITIVQFGITYYPIA